MGRLAFFLAAALFILCSCSLTEEKQFTSQVYAMSTFLSETLYGDNAEKAVSDNERLILELENELSATLPASPIYKLNEAGKGELTGTAREVFDLGLEYEEYAPGAFCITLKRVSDLWDIGGDNERVPEKEEIEKALEVSYPAYFCIEEGYINLGECRVDLGGIAKGYALEKLKENSLKNGATRGIIDLGGSIAAIGEKSDGSEWTVGIKDPFEPTKIAATVSIKDAYVSTSGIYERYFIRDGVRYHHIIDPETGYPANSGLASVTVISDDGVLTDAMSTALFVMGKEKGKAFAEENGIAAVFIDTSGNIDTTLEAEKYSVEKNG